MYKGPSPTKKQASPSPGKGKGKKGKEKKSHASQSSAKKRKGIYVLLTVPNKMLILSLSFYVPKLSLHLKLCQKLKYNN